MVRTVVHRPACLPWWVSLGVYLSICLPRWVSLGVYLPICLPGVYAGIPLRVCTPYLHTPGAPCWPTVPLYCTPPCLRRAYRA